MVSVCGCLCRPPVRYRSELNNCSDNVVQCQTKFQMGIWSERWLFGDIIGESPTSAALNRNGTRKDRKSMHLTTDAASMAPIMPRLQIIPFRVMLFMIFALNSKVNDNVINPMMQIHLIFFFLSPRLAALALTIRFVFLRFYASHYYKMVSLSPPPYSTGFITAICISRSFDSISVKREEAERNKTSLFIVPNETKVKVRSIVRIANCLRDIIE